METIFNIIFAILFIVICFFAGWSFGSCIGINKKLKEITDSQLKLINLLEEENKHYKDVVKHCETVINNDKILLNHIQGTTTFIKNNLIFIKQNMIRRKTPITDE